MIKSKKSLFTVLVAVGMLLISLFLLVGCNEEPSKQTPTIAIKTPFQTEYFLNEELNVSGGVLVYTDENGVEHLINIEENMITGFNSTTYGNKNLFLSYNNLTTPIDYTVYNFVCDYYTAVQQKTVSYNQTRYQDYLDTLIYTFNTNYAGSKNDGTFSYPFTYSLNLDGSFTLTYENGEERGFFANNNIEVIQTENDNTTVSLICKLGDSLDNISIKGEYKQEYFLGQEFDSRTAQIVYISPNGNTTNIDIEPSNISNFDTAVAGEKFMTITYKDLEIELPYTVYNLELGSYSLIYASFVESEETSEQTELNTATMTFYENGTVTQKIDGQPSSTFNFQASTSKNDKTVTFSNLPSGVSSDYSGEYDNNTNTFVFKGILETQTSTLVFKKTDEVLRFGKYESEDGQYFVFNHSISYLDGDGIGYGLAYVKGLENEYETHYFKYQVYSSLTNYQIKITNKSDETTYIEIDNNSFTISNDSNNPVTFTYIEQSFTYGGMYQLTTYRVVYPGFNIVDQDISQIGMNMTLEFFSDGKCSIVESHDNEEPVTREENYFSLIDNGIIISSNRATYVDYKLYFRIDSSGTDLPEGAFAYYIFELVEE